MHQRLAKRIRIGFLGPYMSAEVFEQLCGPSRPDGYYEPHWEWYGTWKDPWPIRQTKHGGSFRATKWMRSTPLITIDGTKYHVDALIYELVHDCKLEHYYDIKRTCRENMCVNPFHHERVT